MVYRTQHYVEGPGIVVSGREDSVSRQIRLSGMLLSILSTGRLPVPSATELTQTLQHRVACRMFVYFRHRHLARCWCSMVGMMLLTCTRQLCQVNLTHKDNSSSVATGVIQCSEKDEFAYQEMIAHLPLCGLAVRAAGPHCTMHCLMFEQVWWICQHDTWTCAGAPKEGTGCWGW